jgi:hypothetical protein
VIYSVIEEAERYKGKDLRGLTWERDFEKEIDDSIQIHHISDTFIEVNGITWTGLSDAALYGSAFVKECWNHFNVTYSKVHWFLRGDFDMYVNVTNLKKMIKELEVEYDPMTEWVSRFGCANLDQDFPHGGTGYLFSNFAVRTLLRNISLFDRCSEKIPWDICVGRLLARLGMPFFESCSNKFVIGFAGNMKDLADPVACPSFSSFGGMSRLKVAPVSVADAVTLHMHEIKMELWSPWVKASNNVSIFWNKRPMFCRPL